MFAVQQAAEGVLWIGLSNTNYESWRQFPVYIFLIFAQVVWPLWIPFSILLIEHGRTRRTILKVILGMGLVISFYLMYCLTAYDVKAEIHAGHILYTLNFPVAFTWVTGVFYFIPTVAPLFVSSIKRIRLLAIAVLASFVISKLYFTEHLISVWCFFAAVLSAMIFWITSKFERPDHNEASGFATRR